MSSYSVRDYVQVSTGMPENGETRWLRRVSYVTSLLGMRPAQRRVHLLLRAAFCRPVASCLRPSSTNCGPAMSLIIWSFGQQCEGALAMPLDDRRSEERLEPSGRAIRSGNMRETLANT